MTEKKTTRTSDRESTVSRDEESSTSSSKVVNGYKREYTVLDNGKCDQRIEFSPVLGNHYEEGKTVTLNVQDILCVIVQSPSGTGYTWGIFGVFKEKPVLNNLQLTHPNYLTTHETDDIVITLPKRLNDESQRTMQKENQEFIQYGGIIVRRPQMEMLGASTKAQSQIQVKTPGVYFVVYMLYRPFGSLDVANVKTVHLIVN